jgi:predicted HAD superfamily phosphohydrolase YqeG
MNELFSRIGFTIRQAYRSRLALRQLMQSPSSKVVTVTQISADYLKQEGLCAVLLDFDGVISAHGIIEPDPQVYLWLKDFLIDFPAESLWIFSNKFSPAREAFFALHFPGVRWLLAKPKKPYPDAARTWLLAQKLKAEEVALIDDRLLTGILCAISLGFRAFLLEKPLINFKKNPVSECFIGLLRFLERSYFA